MIIKFRFQSFLFLILLAFSSSLFAQINEDITKKIQEFQNTPLFESAQWGVYASYIDEDSPIVSHNKNISLSPASNLKLFTTSLALRYLGEDYKFATKVYISGKIGKDGILYGDIYIRGAGDPTLGSEKVKGSLSPDSLGFLLVKKLKEFGIKGVKGAIIADETLFNDTPIPGKWEWKDIGNYYAAAPSALSFGDNLYTIFFKPSDTLDNHADIIKVAPKIPDLKFDNYVTTAEKGSGDQTIIYCPPLKFRADVRGTVPMGVSSFAVKGSIPDPALYTAQFLYSAVKKGGIDIKGKPSKAPKRPNYTKMRQIAVFQSPQLKDIVKAINKKSINLYTEMLLRMVSVEINQVGSTDDGIEVMMKFFKESGIPVKGLHLYDGSGLSRANAITAESMVSLLKFNHSQKYFESFRKSLVVASDTAGDAGWMKKFPPSPELDNNLIMKTGYIEGVRSESGYLKSKSGRLIAFAMIANNFWGKAVEVDEIHREILIELAKLK